MRHWETLGLPWGASAGACEEAFKAIARESHPDKGGDPMRMHDVLQARKMLTGPGRQRYMTMTCPHCKGVGFVKVQQGWTVTDAPCQCKEES